MLPTPTNTDDAWKEVHASYERYEQVSKRDSKSVEDHIELWLHSRLFHAYQQIRYAFQETKSPIETVVFLHLMNWEPCIRFDKEPFVHPQYKIGKYTADFMIECGDFKFVVECDGHDFHERTKQQAAHDKKRDREMTSKGFIVFRFTGSEIWKKPRVVNDTLDNFLFEDSERHLEG